MWTSHIDTPATLAYMDEIEELVNEPWGIVALRATLPEVAARIHADVAAGRMSADDVRAILYYLVMQALDAADESD